MTDSATVFRDLRAHPAMGGPPGDTYLRATGEGRVGKYCIPEVDVVAACCLSGQDFFPINASREG